jgi:hypothetical protein
MSANLFRFRGFELLTGTKKGLKMSNNIYAVFTVQAYQPSQYLVPRGGIFLGKWRSSFAGSSDGKMNVQSACALNTQYHFTALIILKDYVIEIKLLEGIKPNEIY